MIMQRRIVLFSGGDLAEWALKHINKDDVLVGVDRGAFFLVRHGYTPHVALGDFDSVNEAELEQLKLGSQQFISCDPVQKDETDTEMALHWAMEQKPSEIILLGVTGTRWDHTLANVHLLKKALDRGIPCKIVDERNEIQLIDKEARVIAGAYTYVSLLPLSLEVTGITLDGFLYPLHRATLRLGHSLGISNRLEAKEGHIRIESGLLLVIQSKD